MAVKSLSDAFRQIKNRRMKIMSGEIPAVFNSHQIAFIASNMNEITWTVEALVLVVLDQQEQIQKLKEDAHG